MTRALSLVCLSVLFAAGCNRSSDGGETPAPGEKAPAVVAQGEKAPADEVKPGDDRPGMVRCADCAVVVCRTDSTLNGLRLDTSKLDLAGATATAARLRIETGGGESVTVPVAANTLQKPDLAIDDPLKGLPPPGDAGWQSPKAELVVDYTTSKGTTGSAPMELGSVEVKGCP